MGGPVGAAARLAGGRGLWASEGRSAATRQRAEQAGLEDAGSLQRLVAEAQVLISVCPPHAAQSLAEAVAALGFTGLYVDANAISPAHTAEIAATLHRAGTGFVDGGIVGPPVRRAGTTRLYLSGARAAEAAACFEGSPLATMVMTGDIGAASALKMAYAAYTKGGTALQAAILALAQGHGVEADLRQEWEISQPGLADQARASLERAAPKAWRFVPEMEEIAATFEAMGLPGGFHHAAADIYRRLEGHAEDPDPQAAALILELLDDPSKPRGVPLRG
ncbi:MAG: NAD(P)-dependent oxidoreductase [Dehalococcoidia bacterium]|nr:NAD(P)-dependent oxidoreductase [Dehalococcoidia bacterium]